MDEDIDTDSLTTEDLLDAWNLAEYKPVFTEHKITLDTLSSLNDGLIKELIVPIGDRVRFIKKLADWKELADTLQDKHSPSTSISEEREFQSNIINLDKSRCSTPCNSLKDITNFIVVPSTSTETKPLQNFKYTGLKDLLKQTLEGRGLLNLYSESGLLTNKGRRNICNIIIKHILEKGGHDERVSSSVLLTYAQEIAALFKQENISTYYIPYMSNPKAKIRRLAKGKLYDCLQNRKRDYRESTHNTGEKTVEHLNETADNQDPTPVLFFALRIPFRM